MEGLSLIDVSSEDDFLIASEGITIPSSAGNQLVGNCYTSEITDANGGNSLLKITKHMEQALHMSESLEKKQKKSNNCNLRKSLAWDSAFFTNEGVLDPEELAMVNGTFKRAEVCSLPSITEDVRKSAESSSTLDNDSWLVENLEVDLFDNVRASIQKSLGHDDKVADVVHPIAKKPLVKMDTRPLASLKMVESSTHSKKKTPTLDTKYVSSKQPKQAIREDINGGTISKRVLKPPRILSQPTFPTMTSKETSASRNNLGTESSKVLSGKMPSQKSIAVPKKLNGTLNSSTSTTLKSLRPTMASSTQDTSPMTLSASYSVVISNLSKTSSKPTSDVSRKKIASRNADRSSGSATGKIAPKITRTKLVDRKPSNTSICSSSTTKFSSTISPNSSFDSVASGSSSASFPFKPSTDSDTGSSPSISYHSPIKDLILSPGVEPNLENESLRDCSLGQMVKGPGEMFKTTEASRGNTRGSNNISSAKSLKPSGLRMPTPKHGYFDAEKSLTRNVESFPQTRQHSLLRTSTGVGKTIMETIPKNNLGTIPQINPRHKSPQSTGASMNKSDAVNKLNSTNPQPVKTSSRSMDLNNLDRSPVQSLHPRATQKIESVIEQLPESADSCSIPSIVEACHETPLVQKTPFSVKDESRLKISEVATEETNKVASGKLMTALCVGDGLKENIVVFKEENSDVNWKRSRKDSGDMIKNEGTNQKECHLITTVMDKENILPADRVDAMSNILPNKNMDAIIELLGDRVSSLEILD